MKSIDRGGDESPSKRIGSSPGEGGGGGNVKSISGGSVLIRRLGSALFEGFFFADGFAGLTDSRVFIRLTAVTGVIVTSRGGVNCSFGGSYNGIGVTELFLYPCLDLDFVGLKNLVNETLVISGKTH